MTTPRTMEHTPSQIRRNRADALSGRTIRFTFSEGPTKGTSYDHVFRDDGTVTFRDAASRKSDHPRHAHHAEETADEPAPKYGSFEVADDVVVTSYLSSSGYTLTVVLNFETDELFGFASNHEHWYPVRGIFEVISY